MLVLYGCLWIVTLGVIIFQLVPVWLAGIMLLGCIAYSLMVAAYHREVNRSRGILKAIQVIRDHEDSGQCELCKYVENCQKIKENYQELENL